MGARVLGLLPLGLDERRHTAYTIAGKAEALAPGAPVLDQHFLYQAKMQTYYRYRNVDQFSLPVLSKRASDKLR
jgi:hypothetical protein